MKKNIQNFSTLKLWKVYINSWGDKYLITGQTEEGYYLGIAYNNPTFRFFDEYGVPQGYEESKTRQLIGKEFDSTQDLIFEIGEIKYDSVKLDIWFNRNRS